MALGSALVDRARRVYNSPQPDRVDGETVFSAVHEAWFRARLTLSDETESDDSGARRRTIERGTLMFGVRDLSGGSLFDERGRARLVASDTIEVSSKQLGDFTYEVTGDPMPYRRRRRIIGFEAPVTRVEEHAFNRRYP